MSAELYNRPDDRGRISETSVNFYQTTLRNIPDDSYLHTQRCENLKFHLDNTGLHCNFISAVDASYVRNNHMRFQIE
jgi:hypothetical protein